MGWLMVAVAFLGAAGEQASDLPSAPAVPQAGGASPDAKTAPTQEPAKPQPPKLSEQEKIERLLKYVASLDATFIRNGDEYGTKDAVEHMRHKLDYAGKRIKTARQFIKYIATESSMSGKPYLIRFRDGREVKSGEWMLKALERIEAGLPPEKKPAAAAPEKKQSKDAPTPKKPQDSPKP